MRINEKVKMVTEMKKEKKWKMGEGGRREREKMVRLTFYYLNQIELIVNLSVN